MDDLTNAQAKNLTSQSVPVIAKSNADGDFSVRSVPQSQLNFSDLDNQVNPWINPNFNDDGNDPPNQPHSSNSNPPEDGPGSTRRAESVSNRGAGEVTNSLSLFQRIFAGSGHILNDLCASLWFSYLLLYLQEVVGFSTGNAAALMLLGQIVDGISTPLIGYEADRANHFWLCRMGYGRCKSWHLVGVMLVMMSFPFVFSPCFVCSPQTHEWARVIYYAPFIAIFQIGWASSQISHLALIPKLSSDILMRTELLAIRYGFTIASNVTVFLLTWLTVGFGNCTIGPDEADTFRNLALYSVAIGGFFSILFHVFVIEKSDDEVKKAVSLMEATVVEESPRHQDFVDSLSTVTNVRSVASSMAISKVQAQARRRRNSLKAMKNRADREAGQSLLSSQEAQDDMDGASVTVEVGGDTNSNSLMGVRNTREAVASPTTTSPEHRYSMRCLSLGKEKMTLTDWLTLPQFYIVAIMYMSTRLSVNLTQVYMPLYLQKTLELPCGMIAQIPLTMYCAGFVIAIFIKLINKYLGRQLAYALGAALCIIGGYLILFMNWDKGDTVSGGIYGVAVLLGGGASAILVTSLSITADMIGNNIENGAFVYGAMSFCDKLSCGIAVMLINNIIPEDDKAVGPFYQRVLGYTAGGCSFIGVLGVVGLTIIIFFQSKRRHSEGARSVLLENE